MSQKITENKKKLFERLDKRLIWAATILGKRSGEPTLDDVYALRDLIERHEYLKLVHQFTPAEVEALLAFEDPLTVVQSCWVKSSQGQDFSICELLDSTGAYDEFRLTQEEQERRMGPQVQLLKERLDQNLTAYNASLQASIGKVEIIREELRSAGAHLKNAGYTAIDKQPQQVDVSPVGRFESAVLSPMYAVDSVLADLNCIIWSADEAVDDLHEAAEQCRGKHEKSSVRQQLEQKKAKTTAISTPKPGKKSKEAER